MKSSTRALLTTLVIAAIAIITVVVLMSRSDDTTSGGTPPVAGEGFSLLVRENSHRLNSVPHSDVTFVEFLDFECESCRAAYSQVEQLRREYGDRVNFVIRYFPMPAHFNAVRAAKAVEAAAQQDRLEPMYHKMFETQPQWGEQQTPADAIFRGFASELGLNMELFDAAYQDPATMQRIRLDVTDGRTLDVQGTPTFFINGTQIRPQSYDDLSRALDDALNE